MHQRLLLFVDGIVPVALDSLPSGAYTLAPGETITSYEHGEKNVYTITRVDREVKVDLTQDPPWIENIIVHLAKRSFPR